MTRRGDFRNRTEWLLLAGTLGLLRALPGPVGLLLIRAAGRLGYWLLRERREQACRNVMLALSVTRAESGRIVRGAFRGLALNVVETMLLERRLGKGSLGQVPLEDHVTIEGLEHMERALADKRGLLIATAHYGSWECLARVLAQRFKKTWAVARPLDNPLLERMAQKMRRRVLAGTLDKDGGGLKLARLIKSGEMVGLLLDQNAGREGVMIDFLGRLSWHHRVPGIMACRLGAIVLPTYLIREPGYLRFRLVFEAPIEPDPGLSGTLAENDVIRRVSQSLADRVTALPEQWLWLHDRWRRAERSMASPDAPPSKRRPPTRGVGSTVAERTNDN